jgi:phenylacetate-CoA ligase
MVGGLSGLFLGRRWTRAQMETFQTRRLRALVHHAYHRVPYYRRLFDQAGLRPDDIRTLADLERIPLTTRAALQGAPEGDLIARGLEPQKLVVHRSSGSTGEPFSIRRTAFEDRLLQAYRLAVLFRFGLRIRDRRAAVVSNAHFSPALYMRAGLLRYEEVHCLLPLEQILARLREIQPDMLRGYAGTVALLADMMTDADRERIRPRVITTDSETLTPAMRTRISRGFGARVLDFYDSHEFNMIAWECPSSGLYHVSDASMIAEVISSGRAAGPHGEGELAGTALHSWAMPFIRFRLGDLVTRGPGCCPCGAPNSILARIQGRVADYFNLPDGRSIHPYTLVNPIVDQARWVGQYQIVQERFDFVSAKLAPLPGETPGPEAVGAVRRILCEGLGSRVSVQVELVKAIAAAPNGKFRPYFSRVGTCAQEKPMLVGQREE